MLLILITESKDNVELKPLANGHAKTSRSGSIISILSNGTNTGNGVLKSRSVSMSPENLKQIEDAFTTNRDEYANFETSMDSASAPRVTPTIITEDVNTEKKTTVFCPEPDEKQDSESIRKGQWPITAVKYWLTMGRLFDLSFSRFTKQIRILICPILSDLFACSYGNVFRWV